MFPRDADCKLCQLRSDATTSVCIPMRHLGRTPGHTTDMVLVVGHRVGYQENAAGECFVGESGDVLTGPDGYLEEIGLTDRAAVYLTNVSRCFNPADNITVPQYKPCFQAWMKKDLEYLEALPARRRAILCLGAVAARYFWDMSGHPKLNLRDVLALQATPMPPWVLFTTYHPAHLLIQPEYARITTAHLNMLRMYLDNRLPERSRPTIVPPHNPWEVHA